MYRSLSNLEGKRLANESLDVFLQLLCPFDGSIFGMFTVSVGVEGIVPPMPTDGIISNNRNSAI